MRCNSGFLRWPPLLVIIGSCLYLLLTFNTVNSSPLHQRLVRMIREQENEPIISLQNGSVEYQYVAKESAEKCLLDGVLVPKSHATCDSKPGCRVIQKTGECCPEFQCQCERDGKIYATGEKLVDPETPCRVCYCQGGEFICNNVTCYIRNDCEPKYIAGRCCPEYDNCPPLENVKVGPTEMQLVTSPVDTATTQTLDNRDASTTVRSTILYPLPNNNQLGIKIKEITKVEEIRITNPPKIDSIPTVKTHTSTDTTAETPRSTTPAIFPVASTEGSGVNKLEDIEMEQEESTRDTNKSVRQTVTEENVVVKAPEDVNMTEISTTEDDLENFQSSTQPTDAKLYPAVVQMGDRVVIVDHNGKNKPITIVGVEGLQLGGEDLDHIEMSSTAGTPSTSDWSVASADDSTNEIFEVDSSSGTTEMPYVEQERYEEEQDHQGASSSNVFLIASTPIVESSGELLVLNGTFNDEENDTLYDTTIYSPDGGSNETETFDTTYFRDEESTENDTTENWLNARGFSATSEEDTVSTSPAFEESVSHPDTYIEEDELANHELINPEYPPLPEDVSLYGREHGSAPFADDEMEQSRTHHESIEKSLDVSTEKISMAVEKSENTTAEDGKNPETSSQYPDEKVMIFEEEISSPESLMIPPHNPKDDAESLKYQQIPVDTSLQVEDNRSSSSPDSSEPRRVKKYL